MNQGGSGYVRRVSDAARRIGEVDLDGAEGGWEGEKKRGSARRVGGGFTTVVKKRLDVGAVPGTRGASRDSHLRVELLDAEILERRRPGAGGGLGDRARGLGACAKIQTVRCDVEKDVALGCSTAARDPGAARRPRRRARIRRAWIVWIDDHDASQRRTHVPAGPVDRPRAAPTVGAARPSEGKSLCYVGRQGGRTLLRGADDLGAARGGDARGRGGAHGGAGDAGARGEHNGGGGDSGHRAPFNGPNGSAVAARGENLTCQPASSCERSVRISVWFSNFRTNLRFVNRGVPCG